MSTQIHLELTGPRAAATAAVLVARLAELGYVSECAGAALTMRAFCDGAAAGTPLAFEVSPHDPPDFAAEKLLDRLAEEGLVTLDDASMSLAEEAEMQDRLRRLGYIE